MKGLKPFLSLAVGFLACVMMMGCAGSVPQNGAPALNIAFFTVNNGVIGISYKFLLVASGGVHPYTWTIDSGQLPPGLSLNTDGVISGTPTQLGKFSFTARVTDSQSPTQAYDTLATSITINPVLSLTSTTLPTGLVGGPYSATIVASNGLQPYTYTIAGDNPLKDIGLTLVTTPGQNGNPNVATISGTPTSAGVFNFTVQVNDAASEVATAAFTITVVGRLQGPYVLYFNGFDNGQPFYDIGQLVASGDVSGVGNINGTLDQIGPGSSTTTGLTVTGSYNIGQGTNFGTLTVTRSDNGASLNFKMIVEGATNGDSKLILSDPNAPQSYGSGFLKVQSASTLNGGLVSYSFGLFGNDSSGDRYAGVGMFALNALSGGSQTVNGGEEDFNDAGVVTSPPLAITGGAVAQSDATTGRGTFHLTTSDGTQNYIYYVVSQTEWVALDSDADGPNVLVDIQQQQLGGAHGLFTNGSLKGQALIELDGIASGNVPSAAVGVATFDGAGNIARTDGVSGYYTDQSDGGNLSTVQYTTGTYNVDPTCGPIQQTCGRVTVNLTGAATQPVWYLVSSNQAFALDTNAGVTYGTLQPQSAPTGGFTIAALLGSYLGVTITPVLPSVANELDVAITPCCGGVWDQKYDAVGQYGQVNQASFSGAYDCGGTVPACGSVGTALGRFEVTGPGDASTQVSIIYVIGSASGVTGAKGGLVGLNVGQQTDGSTDPDPRITEYTR